MLRLSLLAALFVSNVFAGQAWAQTQASEPRTFAIERFRPSMDGEGILDVEIAQIKQLWAWDIALWLNYANDPLVLRIEDPDGSVSRGPSLVAHRLGGNIVGAVVVLPWLQMGIDVPIALYQAQGSDLSDVAQNPADLSAIGTGDFRLRPKIRILKSSEAFVDLAIIPTVSIPTNSSDAYLGEESVGFEPEVVVSKRIDEARFAANVGYRLRPTTQSLGLTVDDEIIYRLGAAYDLKKFTKVGSEANVSISGATAADNIFGDESRTPLEILVGGSYDVLENLRVFSALGLGLRNGFGTPDFRILAGVRLHTPQELRDKDIDGDGILDKDDKCPKVPEDMDGFKDDYGCEDPDNDGDGVLDADDGAPLDPEDKDGFQDEDGVPDPDNDADGTLDDKDQCPLEAGPLDNSGCPLKDSDDDGIVDRDDRCPAQPEDKDGFEDEDGCPDEDNDADGLKDDVDNCPMEKGPIDNGGCPDPDSDGDTVVDRLDNCPNVAGSVDFQGCKEPQKVRLTAEKIEILEKVFFDSGKEKIQSRSFDLLDSVAKILVSHKEIKKIRIEGHTDDRGAARYNKQLSQRRAEAVLKYLGEKGVNAQRLEALGHGEEKPISANSSRKGRAANRRVEFNIVQDKGEAEAAVKGSEGAVEPAEATQGQEPKQ